MNEREPLVSVIMGTYNQHDRTELMQAVKSILMQTFTEFEFIIYDDGSDEQAAALIRRMSELDGRIRLLRAEQNHGLAFSLNQCIGEARGKYLARMDADDISMPERLQREVDFLENHPNYAWVGCNARIFERDAVWGTWVLAEVPNQYNFLPFSPYVHPSVMFRRELFEEGNRYCVSRETMRCEDYELFMRLYQQGLRGYNLQEELFLYRQSAESYRKRTMRTRWNEMRVRAKYFPQLDLPVSKQILYTLRPVVTGVIPYRMIAWYKKRRLRENTNADKGAGVVYGGLAACNAFIRGLGGRTGAEPGAAQVVFSGAGRKDVLVYRAEAGGSPANPA